MECPFVVGQKVVCIADGWAPGSCTDAWPPLLPVKGQIYTVARLGSVLDLIMVGFKELSRRHQFHWIGFRPLQERPKEADTDISVFTPALEVKTVETAE